MAARRVVTGLAADGKAHFVSDGPAPCVLTTDALPGFETVYLWATDEAPQVPNAGTDRTRLDQKLFPGPDGSRFQINVFPPGFGVAGSVYMHGTSTVDYGVVLSGELTLVLDSGEEVTLRAGDTVVQNGTVHGWRNSSDKPAIAAFVVLGAVEGRDRDGAG